MEGKFKSKAGEHAGLGKRHGTLRYKAYKTAWRHSNRKTAFFKRRKGEVTLMTQLSLPYSSIIGGAVQLTDQNEVIIPLWIDIDHGGILTKLVGQNIVMVYYNLGFLATGVIHKVTGFSAKVKLSYIETSATGFDLSRSKISGAMCRNWAYTAGVISPRPDWVRGFDSKHSIGSTDNNLLKYKHSMHDNYIAPSGQGNGSYGNWMMPEDPQNLGVSRKIFCGFVTLPGATSNYGAETLTSNYIDVELKVYCKVKGPNSMGVFNIPRLCITPELISRGLLDGSLKELNLNLLSCTKEEKKEEKKIHIDESKADLSYEMENS